MKSPEKYSPESEENITELYFSLMDKAKNALRQNKDADISKIFKPLESKGLKYIRSEEIGYLSGFEGSCVQFVEHTTSSSNDEYYEFVNNNANIAH